MKEILSRRLRECRRNCGLTQREAAIYCDITEKAYQNYELGAREPKLSILVRIAALYQVSLDYLVGLTDRAGPYPPRKQGLCCGMIKEITEK